VKGELSPSNIRPNNTDDPMVMIKLPEYPLEFYKADKAERC
jgi:hypothetical protein